MNKVLWHENNLKAFQETLTDELVEDREAIVGASVATRPELLYEGDIEQDLKRKFNHTICYVYTPNAL